MTKWICKGCVYPCHLDAEWMRADIVLCQCVYVTCESTWERVEESTNMTLPELAANLDRLNTILNEMRGDVADHIYRHVVNDEREEPPLPADAPPFKQDDEHEPRVRVWLGDQHERDIQEMAGNLAALKERIDKGEGRLCAIVTDLDERVKKLEHQMRNHYHHTGVWCETDDGSGTERLVK